MMVFFFFFGVYAPIDTLTQSQTNTHTHTLQKYGGNEPYQSSI